MTIRVKLPVAVVTSVLLCVLSLTAGSQQPKGSGTTIAPECDSFCLTAAMHEYLSKMLANQANAVKVASNATIYVNTHSSKLEDNPLLRAKHIKSRQVFADPVTGNVVARTGLDMNDGKVAYASTRLKVVHGGITELEMTFDDSPRVVASYVTFLDPIFTTIVPPDERMSREQLKAVVERYFQGLTDHQPIAADYDERCDRYHSGQ